MASKVVSFGDFEIVVDRNQSILIRERKTGTSTIFAVGDTATYDSYNLIYTGEIVGITDKTVTIVDNDKQRRLKLAEFVRRNWDFNAEEVAEHNSRMLHII